MTVIEKNLIPDLLAKIEELTRKGLRHQAATLLIKLKKQHSIPRSCATKFSELARRNGLPLLSLRALKPFLYPKKILDAPPSPDELMHYAASLTVIGATSESRRILETLPYDSHPKGLLYLAFALIHEWDYHKAIIPLRRYHEHSSLTDYERLIANLNLLNCFAALQDIESAQKTFEKIIGPAQAAGYAMIQANALELYAQTLIQQDKLTEALEALGKAESLIGGQFSIFLALIKKWQLTIAIKNARTTESGIAAGAAKPMRLETMNAGDLSALQAQLVILRRQCAESGYWEVVRDIDLILAKATDDQELFNRVYLGSPFEHFRRRAEMNLPKSLRKHTEAWIPLNARMRKDDSQKIPPPAIRPLALDVYERQKTTRPWLDLLTRDLYKPISLGAAHEFLFPHQHFNPDTSPKRVLNSIYRFNKVMKKDQIPLLIKIQKMEFSLESLGPDTLTLRIHHLKKRLPDPSDNGLSDLLDLYDKIGLTLFDSKTGAHLMSRPHRSARHRLAKGLQEGLLRRLGSGTRTYYQFDETRVHSLISDSPRQALDAESRSGSHR